MSGKKSYFTEAVEYLAAVASVAAVLGVLYFVWPIREAPTLEKETRTPIVRLDLAEMKVWYDRHVSQPRFYKRHDKADKFFKKWGSNKAVIFPLGEMDRSEFRGQGRSPDEIDWEGHLLEGSTRRMTVPKSITPNFESMMDIGFRIPFSEHHNVGWFSGTNIMEEIAQEFPNKRMAAFVDAYSRNRRIYTPIVLKNNSGADAVKVQILINGAQYPGAEFVGISSAEGIGKLAALRAGETAWFFIRTQTAPVQATDILVLQEGERVKGNLLIALLGVAALLLLIWRYYSHG